jgi:hypothetical protein
VGGTSIPDGRSGHDVLSLNDKLLFPKGFCGLGLTLAFHLKHRAATPGKWSERVRGVSEHRSSARTKRKAPRSFHPAFHPVRAMPGSDRRA